MKPFSESCEQNKSPILDVLKQQFTQVKSVLEIGSGTGQHAVYFARQLPHLHWHTSDLVEHHHGINNWINDYDNHNISPPIALNVTTDIWPKALFDAVFSANTTHIMGWTDVQNMFAGISQCLVSHGKFCLYGPFNYAGEYTSESNARFDQWLKQRDPNSGIRNFENLCALSSAHHLSLTEDIEMPANNRILVWQKL